MSKVRKSIFLSFGQNYFSFMLQFVASIIIARLLTPAEIGIFSVAMVFIGLAHRLRDFGAASYVIQEKDLTPDKIRAAFSMTLITAWVMALAIWLGADYAAEFYRESGIRSVMWVISLNFLLIPFGTIPMAYMQRKMDFEHIALINVSSNTVSTMTSVVLAYMGFSYLALAWGAVVGIVCNIVLAQVWRPENLPLLPGLREIRRVFSFGSLSSLVMILSDISQGAAEMILGRMSGMGVVGYYGRAMGLVSMFDRFVMSALWSVALPHFAEQSRNQGAMKHSLLRSMTYATGLAWPFFACLGFLAEPVITILYGDQWLPSIPLLQLLCIAMMLLSPFLLMSSIMTAIGQMKQNFYLLSAFVPVRILSLLIAAPFGLQAIGISFIVVNFIGAGMYLLQGRWVLDIRLGEVAGALKSSAGVVLMSALPLIVTCWVVQGGSVERLWIELLVGMTGCVSGWVAGLFLFAHPLLDEIRKVFAFLRKFQEERI